MKVLRWIFVLPGAILTGLISNVLIFLLLKKTFTAFGHNEFYGESFSYVISYFASAIFYILSGAEIAPSNKSKVAMGLLILFIPLEIVFLVIQIKNSEFLSITTLAWIIALVGIFVGYISVLDDQSRR